MTSVGQCSMNRRMFAETPVAPIWPTYKSDQSARRIDIALLVSALFLQLFTLPFGDTFLALNLLSIGLILGHQFLSGKLLIQSDRLLWFLGFALVSTCSLLLNFKSMMLTGYFQFMVFFALFTLIRPSTPDQYKRTLQAFQFFVLLLSCLAVAQFVAQFVLDGTQLINFYGIVPDFLFSDPSTGTHEPRIFGKGIIKSTGFFLAEPSYLSQMAGLGILIEILEFRRPRYLLVMALGFLVAYSGTGLMLLLLFLPLAGLRHSKAGLSALLVVIFALGLFATGIIDLSAFTSRVGEFQDTGASGFSRFVSPFWLTAKQFGIAPLQQLLVGSGPGTVKTFGDAWFSGFPANWFKVLYEYGIIGALIFVCFLASCLRRSSCPGLVVAAIIFAYLFLQGITTIIIVLCTLSRLEPRRGRIGDATPLSPRRPSGGAPHAAIR